MGRPWVIVVPHPDDDVLMYSVAVRAHLAAGREPHVVALTAGTSSGVIRKINGIDFSPWWGVRHNPEVEGYQPLTPETLGAARLREQRAALGCLGVPANRIHYAWDLIGEPVIDGSVTVDQVRRALLALLPKLPTSSGLPGVWAPSDIVDDNPDHRAAGTAARQLLAERPDLIADVRWAMLPRYVVNNDPRLGQVTEAVYTPATTTDHNACINSYRAYASWQPPHAYACGYQSVDDWRWIDGRSGSPRSWYHK